VRRARHSAATNAKTSAERQNAGNLQPISSLAYFRKVALRLTKEETDPAYIAYIAPKYQGPLRKPPTHDQKTVTSPPRPRGS